MSRGWLALVALAVPLAPAAADPVVTQRIDREVAARLRAAGVVPAGRADDATLVRRIHLDLLGRPPTEAEADAFRADAAADKVHRLIDRLRRYPEAAAHWRRVIADWLHVGDEDRLGAASILGFLAVAVGQNAGWDRLARDLLDPIADDPRQSGASEYLAAFLRDDFREADPKVRREAAAVAVASAFFGAQLQCARCHDHPHVPEWTKARFDGLAAAFQTAQVERRSGRRAVIKEKPGAKPTTVPEFLDGTRLDGKERYQTQLVAHVLRPEVPHFKRAVVNRVWRQFLGRGLVEPVDMIHLGNPPSHPELFEFLADDFAAHEYNFDRLLSSILHSEAYLRSARWTGPADRRPAAELFAVAELRPLSGAQAAWGVMTGLELMDVLKKEARRLGAIAPGPGVAIEVRYAWESTTQFRRLAGALRTPPTGSATSPGHAIHLAFDPPLHGLLDAPTALPAQLAEEPNDEKLARRAYWVVLNRSPTADEVTLVRDHLKAATTRTAGCRDLVWALLAGAEFRFNH